MVHPSNQTTSRHRTRQILSNLPQRSQAQADAGNDTATRHLPGENHPSAVTPNQSAQLNWSNQPIPVQSTAGPDTATPPGQRPGASGAATVVGYSAVALAVVTVIIGGFIEGFHVSSYGLASILGFLAVIRVVLSGFTNNNVDSRSPWVDATVMASSAIVLITLTAGIPLD